MKVLCGIKKKGEGVSSCYQKKKREINRYIEDNTDINNEDIYELLEDYRSLMGFQFKKGDYVMKCEQHTFGVISYNETSVNIPIITVHNNRVSRHNLFIGIPSSILK